jgi:hypothetical protein
MKPVSDDEWLSDEHLLQFQELQMSPSFYPLGWIIKSNSLLRAVQRRFKRGFSKLGGFLDPHGLHWAGIYVDAESRSVEYFDSCGFSPPAWAAEQMAEVASAFNFSVQVAKQQHQEGTDDCGVYVCMFLKGRLEGKTFDDFESARIRDADTINFRRTHFQ